MTDLKPCPFCGEEVNVFNYCGWWVSHWCETLDRYIDTRPFFTKAIAIDAWNTREERTCNLSDHVADVAWCSECKEPMKYPDHPNYCPNCGAKVVSEWVAACVSTRL